jgi:DNA invertase Pin-like site-specific DNA recombinase
MSANGTATGALTYGRQSMGNDKSIAEQLELGAKRCAAEDWPHLGEYSDRVSASRYATRKRDDWPRLLDALTRPEVGVLWLWETSRGDRKLSSWAAMLETCRDNNVRIYVETHGRLYDMANARDWRTLAEDGVDNAYESDKVSTRTKRSADARAAAGRPHSGAGYGYRNEHDTRTGRFTERVTEPAEAANIAELLGRIRQGHSLRSIERDWLTRGIATRPPEPCRDGCTKPHRNNGGKHVAPGTPGKPFTAQYLRSLAMTAAYAGLRVHLTTEQRRTDPYSLEGATEGDWPAIVDRETFYAVREILTAPERKTTRPGRAVHLLSVSPAARCGVCGGPLHASNRGGARTWAYFCARSGHVRVSEPELDALAEAAIIGYLSRPDNYPAFTEPADGPELARVRGDLAGLRSQRRELADAVAKHGKPVTWALAADEQFTASIAALEARERELTTPDKLRGLMEPGADVARRWATAPMATRREVARIVLAADRVGVIAVRRTRAGARGVPAVERVDWLCGA